MTILRNRSHGEIIRVCMRIFTTAPRIKKYSRILNKIPHLTSTEHRLLSGHLLCRKESILARYPFLGFQHRYTLTPIFALPPVLQTFHRAVTRASLSGDHFLYSRDRSLEGYPIHPNRCESSKAVDESSNRKSIRGLEVLWCRSSEKPSLMTRKRIPEISLQEKRIYSESVCDRGLQMLSNRHDSTPIEGLVTKKWRPVIPDVDLQDTANRHPVWRIVICCDESFDSSPTVSNRQHLLRCIVYYILTIDFRSFHALRTWKVHVVMSSYHATHFHSLLTCTCAPLDFRYVNARFDFWHTMVISNIAYASRRPVY